MNGIKDVTGRSTHQSRIANTLEMLSKQLRMLVELQVFTHLLGNGLKSWVHKLTALMYHIFLFGIQTTIMRMTTQTGLKSVDGHGLQSSNTTKTNKVLVVLTLIPMLSSEVQPLLNQLKMPLSLND